MRELKNIRKLDFRAQNIHIIAGNLASVIGFEHFRAIKFNEIVLDLSVRKSALEIPLSNLFGIGDFLAHVFGDHRDIRLPQARTALVNLGLFSVFEYFENT